jgi:hypothetical protein
MFDASLSAERLTDRTHNTIISLIRNEEVSVKDIQNEINQELEKIRKQSKPISKAIMDEVYDTHVDCCPTYWTLLKRFV